MDDPAVSSGAAERALTVPATHPVAGAGLRIAGVVITWLALILAAEGLYHGQTAAQAWAVAHLAPIFPTRMLGMYVAISLGVAVGAVSINLGLFGFELTSGRRSDWRTILRSSAFFAGASLLGVPPVAAISILLRHFGAAPLVPPTLQANALVLIAYPLIYLFVTDVFQYWWHRAMHAAPLLWRFHEPHHSIEDLNVFNSYVHFGEYYVRALMVNLPLLLLMAPPAGYVLVLTALITVWGQYAHTNARALALPDALRYVLVDNIYHHHHHALDPAYRNSNFAAHFPIVDWIFGTQRMPKGRDFPVTGVSGSTTPVRLDDFLWRPFRKSAESYRD